jgi:hypothetical protein
MNNLYNQFSPKGQKKTKYIEKMDEIKERDKHRDRLHTKSRSRDLYQKSIAPTIDYDAKFEFYNCYLCSSM